MYLIPIQVQLKIILEFILNPELELYSIGHTIMPAFYHTRHALKFPLGPKLETGFANSTYNYMYDGLYSYVHLQSCTTFGYMSY